MRNISKHDYVFWNRKTKKPVEGYDIVYHHSTIVEMINCVGELKLGEDVFIECVAALPIKEQIKFSEAIEKTK